jgi:hypothetical protein
MRILFVGNPLYGHLNPMLPLARAAQNAGHDVVVATGADFAPLAEREGLTTWSVGLTHAQAGGDDQASWLEYFEASARERMADLAPRCAAWHPDLVIHEETELAGPVVLAGLPRDAKRSHRADMSETGGLLSGGKSRVSSRPISVVHLSRSTALQQTWIWLGRLRRSRPPPVPSEFQPPTLTRCGACAGCAERSKNPQGRPRRRPTAARINRATTSTPACQAAASARPTLGIL